MTTDAFAAKIGPAARAMKQVFDLASAGQSSGTIRCPKYGSQLRWEAKVPHRSSGQCTAGGCLRWSTV